MGQGQRGQRLRVLRPPIDHLRLRPYRGRATGCMALRTGVAGERNTPIIFYAVGSVVNYRGCNAYSDVFVISSTNWHR